MDALFERLEQERASGEVVVVVRVAPANSDDDAVAAEDRLGVGLEVRLGLDGKQDSGDDTCSEARPDLLLVFGREVRIVDQDLEFVRIPHRDVPRKRIDEERIVRSCRRERLHPSPPEVVGEFNGVRFVDEFVSGPVEQHRRVAAGVVPSSDRGCLDRPRPVVAPSGPALVADQVEFIERSTESLFGIVRLTDRDETGHAHHTERHTEN